MPARNRGMTLLELLVVLTLVTLLGTLIVQGVGVFLARYDTVQRAARDAGRAALRQHWFGSTVEGMVPYDQPESRFRGDGTSFAGVTMQPLGADSGMPVKAAWMIEQRGASAIVAYRESAALTNDGGFQWTVWVADQPLAFQYAGTDATWRDHWPPPGDSNQRIPRLVRLVRGSETIWLAQLDLHPVPIPVFTGV